VIAILSKFDGLITAAQNELRSNGLSIKAARKQAPELADSKLDMYFKQPLKATTFPPAGFVCLTGRAWR
jgi:hypothetical protein